MKWMSLIIMGGVLGVGPLSGQRTDAALSAMKLPPFQRVVLTNGLTLLLMGQHKVPLVSLALLVRAGATADPAGQEGVAALTAGLLRRGTTRHSADEIAAELDFMGGQLEFRAEYDFTIGQAEFLRKDLGPGLDLVAEVIRQPAFPASEVKKLADQTVDAIKQERDEPGEVIGKYFNGLLFEDHPYGRPLTGDETSVATLDRAAVGRFYARHYVPAAMILAVAGDVDATEMERELRRRFEAWSTSPLTATPLPASRKIAGHRCLVIDKPDATQTFFMLGNVGIHRTHPDRVGVELVNTLFGGRFTSMLNDALRVNSGLTYGARSRFQRGVTAGPFNIYSYTPNATTEKAVVMALDVLRRLHADGLTGDQLASGKAYIKGKYPTQLETTDQLALCLTQLVFDGLDAREIDEYFQRLDAVTLADARRLIREHFPLDDLALVMIGKKDVIRPLADQFTPGWKARSISQPGYR